MKKQLFLFLLMFGVMLCSAQSDIVTSGGTASGAGGTATFTIGQIADQMLNDGNLNIQEGVQQPYEISVVGISSHEEITLEASIYPNPTIASLTLSIRNQDWSNRSWKAILFDMNGRQISAFNVLSENTTITTDGLAAGNYMLRVLDGDVTMKVFKVVKMREL